MGSESRYLAGSFLAFGFGSHVGKLGSKLYNQGISSSFSVGFLGTSFIGISSHGSYSSNTCLLKTTTGDRTSLCDTTTSWLQHSREFSPHFIKDIFFLVGFLLLLGIMLRQKGSYLRLVHIPPLATILVAAVISGGRPGATRFARP